MKDIVELRDKLEKIIYAYAIGAMGCDSLLNDVDDYHILLDEIKKLSKEKGILSYVEKSFKEYKAKGIAEHVRECTESQRIIEQTSQTIDRLYEIVADDAKLVKVVITVAQQLGSYVDKINKNDELARYEKGKLTAEVLALFIGTEEASAAKKLVEFERFLARAVTKDIEKVGLKLRERAVIAESKIVNQAGRQNWNGFANIFKANADEIAEATTKIKNYRTSTSLSGKNCGYLEGSVNGSAIDNKIWLSGPANTQVEPQIFTAIYAEGGGGRSWLRNTDSEYKMLNKLASDLGGTPGAVKPNVNGELKIVSELEYCNSCQGVIQQFNEMFPNVKLILVDGAK